MAERCLVTLGGSEAFVPEIELSTAPLTCAKSALSSGLRKVSACGPAAALALMAEEISGVGGKGAIQG